MPPRTNAALICSALSFAVGAWAFVKTQAVTKETFEPILAACTSTDYASMEDFVEQTGYHAYDKRVGLVVFDFLVCLITQFLLDLTKMHPAGLIAWGSVVVVSFPVGVLCSLEAGRQNSRGLILWPTLNGFLIQLFGISIIFPALWVPAYTWGGSDGVVSPTLAKTVFFLSLPAAVFSTLAFYLDTDSSAWTSCAGILGGPVLPLVGLAVWIMPAPEEATVSKQVADQAAETSALSFAAAGVASLLAWICIVSTAFSTYQWDYTALLNDIWWQAHPSVQFMTIDAVVLYLGLVLHIGTRSLQNMAEALATTLLFGPGAACAMALASLEMDRLKDTPAPVVDTDKKDQ